jgi:hypothetical protein
VRQTQTSPILVDRTERGTQIDVESLHSATVQATSETVDQSTNTGEDTSSDNAATPTPTHPIATETENDDNTVDFPPFDDMDDQGQQQQPPPADQQQQPPAAQQQQQQQQQQQPPETAQDIVTNRMIDLQREGKITMQELTKFITALQQPHETSDAGATIAEIEKKKLLYNQNPHMRDIDSLTASIDAVTNVPVEQWWSLVGKGREEQR